MSTQVDHRQQETNEHNWEERQKKTLFSRYKMLHFHISTCCRDLQESQKSADVANVVIILTSFVMLLLASDATYTL